MRTLLITGPGGSGRTTLAAATARAAAQEGIRTLVLGADRGDTLGAALGVPTGPEPVAAGPGITAWRPDPAAAFRADLTAFQKRATTVLDLLGAQRLDPEEVTPLPGAEELSLLRALRDAALADRHDLLVVDLPPPTRPSPCSPCPRNCAATCAACCLPNGRPPAPCARSSAAWPACPCPPSGSTTPPPAGTWNSPPSRPS